MTNALNGYVGDPGGTCGYALINYGSIANKLGIRRFDSLVYGLGAGRSFNINGVYPII